MVGIRAVRERYERTGLVRTPKDRRPLRGTHRLEAGTGKSVIETVSFGAM